MTERALDDVVETVEDYGAGIRAMINRDFLDNPTYGNQQDRANRVGAHPQISLFADALVKRAKKVGIPLFPHCMVRTPAEQAAAYVRGASLNDGKGPYPHRFGAVDIIHGVKGWNLPEESWDIIGHMGFEEAKKLGIDITWGGDWDGDGIKTDQKLYDPAHWELTNWRVINPVTFGMPGMSLDPVTYRYRKVGGGLVLSLIHI